MNFALAPDIDEAIHFLEAFAEDGLITFQIFDDRKLSRRADHFTSDIHDPKTMEYLAKANNDGLGIYFMLNRGDGNGRSENNVSEIRVFGVDLDGAPKEPVVMARLSPHFITETSPGRFHCFYLINPKLVSSFENFDAAKQWFATRQVSLARKFHADESVKDLPRVFRVPGFWHQKGNPYLVKIIHQEATLPYDSERLFTDLELSPVLEKVSSELKSPVPAIDQVLVDKIKPGARHMTLLRIACKYAHVYRLNPLERNILLKEINNEACDPPIGPYDLERINNQATRYAEEARAQVETVDISALLEKHKSTAEEPRALFSDYLLDPPGMVGDMMRYILASSTKPQPELALGAAFVACATVMGRKICTETNLRTNIYFMSLMDTGGGKDWPRQAIKKIFMAIEAPQRAAIEDVTSDSAMAEALTHCPSQVFLFDEFGRLMKNVTHKNAGAHLTSIPTFLMRLFSSAGGPLYAKAFADPRNNRLIHQPNVSLLATSVEKSFFDSITNEAVGDGLLNRILFLQAAEPDPPIRKIKQFDPPDSLVEAFRAWESLPYDLAGGNLATVEASAEIPPRPRVVPFADGAEEVFQDMERELRVRRKELRRENMHGLFTRVYENALKIALVLAGGQNIESPQISIRDAEYACNLALTCTENLLVAVGRNVSDNRLEAHHKLVLNLVKDAGPQGIPLRDLGIMARRRGGLDARSRNDILRELQELGCVQQYEVPGARKPTTILRFIKD